MYSTKYSYYYSSYVVCTMLHVWRWWLCVARSAVWCPAAVVAVVVSLIVAVLLFAAQYYDDLGGGRSGKKEIELVLKNNMRRYFIYSYLA